MKPTSRRSILRAGIATTAAATLGSPLLRALAQDDDDFNPGGRVLVDYDETVSFKELLNNPPAMGRVETRVHAVFSKPERRSGVVDYVRYSDVVPIFNVINTPDDLWMTHNPYWFDIGSGFVHSSPVVPVGEFFNDPVERVPLLGFWGEVTVPTSWQHLEPKLRSRRYYDLAYGAIFKITELVEGEDKRLWYRIADDAYPTNAWWVQASHVRRVFPDEFAPISPYVRPQDKLIEVLIDEQTLTCYEGSTPVFKTRIASGTSFQDAAGTVHLFNTPYGEHYIQRKTPSRHMIGGSDINDEYDLPGVPWCTFFSRAGAAIHGCYWHNDYGRPRSHGCINVTNDAAKWVYRWALPEVSYRDDYYFTPEEERDIATQIVVKHTREA